MSKVPFPGLDVYEDRIAAEAAKPTWEGTVDSPSLARFVCSFRKPQPRQEGLENRAGPHLPSGNWLASTNRPGWSVSGLHSFRALA
jgi:hypothetical protein